MSGTVVVYQRSDGRLYVSSYSRNSEGWTAVNGWHRTAAAEASDAEIGRLVLTGLTIEDISAEDLKPLLTAAGVRSYTAFSRDARAVGVNPDEDGGHVITSTSNPNRRRNNGFLNLAEGDVTVPPGASPSDVGAAVREGLSRCVVEHR